jgi:hypothetical protein
VNFIARPRLPCAASLSATHGLRKPGPAGFATGRRRAIGGGDKALFSRTETERSQQTGRAPEFLPESVGFRRHPLRMDRNIDIPDGWRPTSVWRPCLLAMLFLSGLLTLWAQEPQMPRPDTAADDWSRGSGS